MFVTLTIIKWPEAIVVHVSTYLSPHPYVCSPMQFCGHAILIKDMSGRQILLHATYAWRLDQEHLGTSQDLKYLIA